MAVMTYQTGTVTLTNGDQTVALSGGVFTGNVNVGGIFAGPDNVPYVVGSVTDDTHLELASAFTGVTGSGLSYQITNDFTPKGFPIVQEGDSRPWGIFSEAMKRIDAQFGTSAGEMLAAILAGLETGALNDGPLGGFRNRLINGNFGINQRAATSVADGVYAHDRWYGLTSTGNVSISTLSDVENGMTRMARLTQPDVTAKRISYAQVIEGANCKDMRGKEVTFRFGRFRCSASQAIRFAVLEWTGTEDTVIRDVVNSWTNGTFTPGNFFNATTLAVAGTVAQTPAAATLETGPSLTVTLGSTFNNLVVMAWTEGTLAQNGTLDLGLAQIEQGGVATPFERRLRATEMDLCQEYFERISGTAYSYLSVGQAATTSTFDGLLTFRRKRKVPAPTPSAPGDFQILAAGPAAPTCTALSFNQATTNACRVAATVSGTPLVAGQSVNLRLGNNVGYIDISAEL